MRSSATTTRIVAEATNAGGVASVKTGVHHGEIASDKKVKIPRVKTCVVPMLGAVGGTTKRRMEKRMVRG